jgi:GntR family transcriptional regulator, transcriptional repressor for pyruvate dehydrogenase complex
MKEGPGAMKPNLTATLVDELRRRIVDGEIAPGDKLPSENTLIAEHGVSRTVVREAITRLQAEGLVHTRRGSGSYALTPPVEPDGSRTTRPVRTLQDRRALVEYRTGVESEAAALAAVRRTEQQVASLRAANEDFSRSGTNPAAALAHDFEFHRTVAEASGNPFLQDAIAALGPAMIAMPRYRLEASAAEGETTRLAEVAAEHAAVLAAVESGDAMAAAAAMRTHLVNSRHRLERESGR